MSKLYATFNSVATAQAWVDSVNAALGYPNGTTQTYATVKQHQSNSTASVLTDDDAGALLNGLTRITKAQAITQGYLPEPVVFP